MAYSVAQYKKVLQGMLDARSGATKRYDAQIDKLLEAIVKTDTFGADDQVELYVWLRDQKDAAGAAGDRRKEHYREAMDQVGNRLLARLNDQKVRTMGSAHGTFYKEEVYKPSCADWPTLYRYIRENDAFELLEKRLTKKEVVQYIKDDKDLPPGISLNSSFEIRVRRSND